jgi:glycosyltransferase involved in cell wall biosynthesis
MTEESHKQMKILLIHTLYRFKGGEESVVEAETSLLKNNNHKVYSLFFENPDNPIKALVMFLISIFNPFSYYKVIKAIKKFQPDVIHLHNWCFAASPAVLLAAHIKHIPIVATLHNYRLLCPSGILFHNGKLFLYSLQQDFPWKAIKNKVYRNSVFQTFWLAFVVWLHKKIGTWDKVDKYIVLTEFSKQIYTKSKFNISPDKFVIKPNFVNSINRTSGKRTNSFLFIGRLSEEKGIEFLLDIAAKTGFNLKIGGDGPLRDKTITYCEKHTNIQYLGNLNKQEVSQNMQECTALIFPSVWYEGMPLTIIEAFSQGLPVIASDLGAMSSMIKNGYNGLLFETGNTIELQSKLIEWQNKSQEEKDIFSKNACQTYLDNYTPEQNLSQLISVYNSVFQ